MDKIKGETTTQNVFVKNLESGFILSLKKSYKSLIAKKISIITRYYDELIAYAPRLGDDGVLFDLLECSHKKIFCEKEFEHYLKNNIENDESYPLTKRMAVLLNAHFNHSFSIQEKLTDFYKILPRSSRIIVVLYSPYFKWIYEWAAFLGLRSDKESPETFITENDLRGLCSLSSFELVSLKAAVYFPFSLFGLGKVINEIFALLPILSHFSLTSIAVLRPIKKIKDKPSLSIVIPARNEKGNIEAALQRMPKLCDDQEVIFVEGHSKDDTWDEINRVIEKYKDSGFKLSALRQKGKGKADAVRIGFEHAKGELLTILDADLTMPPEKLGLFYDAFCRGHADFINGSRLLYPMEGGAMRFLNRLGNVFFAKALSYVLSTPLSDSLCGTKLMLKSDYERFIKWRKDFGDFDPFGDFEIIFPASILGLGIIDIPIRYGARTYGETNISRFRHGFMLLKMTWIGFWKVKLS